MRIIHALAVAISSSFLVACASQSADQDITFPKLDSSHLTTGAFVEPAIFTRIQPGLDRDQVRLILGSPHFNEGLIAKNTWNYAFNFKTGQGSEYITCQYQVQFDQVDVKPQPTSHQEQVPTRKSLMVAEHWENAHCESLVRGVVTPPPQKPEAQIEALELAADALFAFAGSARKDLNAAGLRSLDNLAAQINKDYVDIEQVHIIGHTDRIGSAASNYTLSLARANTVAGYLIEKGLARHLATTEGRGLTEPVVDCGTSTQKTSKLIACLQPNRRVVLEIKATRVVQ